MVKDITKTITSYDLLKMAAVLLMVADHVGYYFDEHELWWRVFGRMCVPIWFFLIGFARGRDLSPRLWIGGFILVGASMLAGEAVIPPNILFTMLLARAILDPLMRLTMKSVDMFVIVCAVLTVLVLPTFLLWEYGTQGIILVMFGYIARNRPAIDGGKGGRETVFKIFALFAFSEFIFMQGLYFGVDLPQLLVLIVGVLAVFCALYNFRPVSYPDLTDRLGVGAGVVRFFGRRTLEIYVGHLILFKFLGVLTDPERFAVLQWKWFDI